jgi:catechol 2,3-dioxygenase-like lactoylglutathione lyase family enzyme
VARPPLAGVRHLKIPVTDLARSKAWYERVFGLQVTLEFADDDGVVRGLAGHMPGLGDVLVALRVNPEAARGCRNFDPFHFGVEDRAGIEAWASYLDGLGIGHSPAIEATIGWLLVLNDPDGLEIHLYSWASHGVDQSDRPGYGRRPTASHEPTGGPPALSR